MNKALIIKKWAPVIRQLERKYPKVNVEDTSIYLEELHLKYNNEYNTTAGYGIGAVDTNYYNNFKSAKKDIKSSFVSVMIQIYLKCGLKNDKELYEEFVNLVYGVQYRNGVDVNEQIQNLWDLSDKFVNDMIKRVRKEKLDKINEKS